MPKRTDNHAQGHPQGQAPDDGRRQPGRRRPGLRLSRQLQPSRPQPRRLQPEQPRSIGQQPAGMGPADPRRGGPQRDGAQRDGAQRDGAQPGGTQPARRRSADEGTRLNSSTLAWGALGLAGILYGYNWVVMKSALRHTDPATFAAMRTFLGALFLFAMVVLLRRPLRPPKLLLTLVVGLFGITGSIGLTIWALEHGQAGKTSVLVYTMPVWMLIMAWVVFGERICGRQWIFVVTALVGLVFVISPWEASGSLFSNLLGVAAGVCSAAGSITAKLLTRDKRVDLLSLNAWQLLLGSLPLVAIALLTVETGPEWTGWFVAALLYNAILASGVALLLWFYSLRHLPAGMAGLGRLVAPVIGVLAAWIQLGEQPTVYEGAGMVLIIVALAALARRQMADVRHTG